MPEFLSLLLGSFKADCNIAEVPIRRAEDRVPFPSRESQHIRHAVDVAIARVEPLNLLRVRHQHADFPACTFFLQRGLHHTADERIRILRQALQLSLYVDHDIASSAG
ncbi:hypothetical protein SDC9_121470 [bioreactor metagenome]|uniref:Uncharacterized protein n=1 Tax=bioreactor metagenome TaxID=1076179 RepID=A0A645CC73_9ZZZZ